MTCRYCNMDIFLNTVVDTTSESTIQRTLTDTLYQLQETLAAKSHDYSKGDDEFANFKNSARRAGISVEQSLIVRMEDKFSRICNLLNTEAQVKEEAIEDTINDFIGYLVILKAYRLHRISGKPDFLSVGRVAKGEASSK